MKAEFLKSLLMPFMAILGDAYIAFSMESKSFPFVPERRSVAEMA